MKDKSASTLRIAHVVFSTRVAGAEQHCIDLAHMQLAQGHDVHVVGPGKSAIPEYLRAGVHYHGLAWPVWRAMRLQQWSASSRIDICHAHLGPACRAVVSIKHAARVATLHVGFKAHQHAEMDGLICVNSAQTKSLGNYAGDVQLIHNWPVERVAQPGAVNLRQALGIRDDHCLVCSVGRLHPSKGMDVLLAAFLKYAPSHAHLALVGEGAGMAALKAMARGHPRVHLLGFRRDVDQILQVADLFVSPSRQEACPLVVLEAMRSGCPIIATRTLGACELLSGQPGKLVDVDDLEALGQAMVASLETLSRSCYVDRCRVNYDLTRYQREVAGSQVENFYRQVLTAHAARPIRWTVDVSRRV